MMQGFDLSRFDVDEFCVVFGKGKKERHVSIPIDRDVKDALRDVLTTTLGRLEEGKGKSWSDFEVSEEYADGRSCRGNLDDEVFAKIQSIFNITGRDINSASLREGGRDVRYYYATYSDKGGKRAIGFRLARGSKTTLRGRLVHFVQDTL